ncbi:MAG: hypothetical protein SGILL_002951, partial [Bacillariaceae sp.]
MAESTHHLRSAPTPDSRSASDVPHVSKCVDAEDPDLQANEASEGGGKTLDWSCIALDHLQPLKQAGRQETCSTSTSSMETPPLLLDEGTLYGREQETADLLHAYQKCKSSHLQPLHAAAAERENGTIVLLTGASGTGKTALARSLEPIVQNDGGLFLWGKNDQIQGLAVQPYAPFAAAFDRLWIDDADIECVVTGVQESVTLKQQIEKAVVEATRATRTSVRVLTDAIPALHKFCTTSIQVSGDELDDLIPIERSHRNSELDQSFKSTSVVKTAPLAKTRNDVDVPTIALFCAFIKAFCSSECPLVFLLDDLQWLDPSSLALFKALAVEQRKIPGFLLMGTCRGNEVGFHDDLSIVLRSLDEGQSKVIIQDIQLTNLGPDAVQDLVNDLLGSLPPAQASDVALEVFRQTNGDVFFTLQAIRDLYDNHALEFDKGTQEWKLSRDRTSSTLIASADTADDENSNLFSRTNSHAFSTTLFKWIKEQESDAVEHVLMVASCLGTEFSQNLITAGTSKDYARKEVISVLVLLKRRGFLTRDGTKKSHFRWAHDQFQKIAYALIPDDARASFHAKVGMNLLRHLPPTEVYSNPFLIVNMFCLQSPEEFQTRGDFKNEEEKAQLISLCVVAGERAARTSAFDTALVYLRLGLLYLGPADKGFRSNYGLCLRLFNAAAEMECCMGNYQEVGVLVATVERNATSLEDKLRAYETEIYSLGCQKDIDGATSLGLKVLEELGEGVSSRPFAPFVMAKFFQTKRRISRITTEDVVGMKQMQDWRKTAALRIFFLITPHLVHQNRMMLVAHMTVQSIAQSLKHGLSEMSCFGFIAFGTVLCKNMGHVEEGRRCVEIGKTILQETNAQSLSCRVDFCLWGLIRSWQFPFKDAISPLQEAAKSGFMSGDTEQACLNLCVANTFSLFSGENLVSIAEEQVHLNEQFRLRNQETVLSVLCIAQQAVQNLRGLSGYTSRLTGEFLVEQDANLQANTTKDQNQLTTIAVFQCMLS